jgi:hypothetical protein
MVDIMPLGTQTLAAESYTNEISKPEPFSLQVTIYVIEFLAKK